MNVALVAARLILAVIFFVAGAAKLADVPGSRRAATAFGLPSRLAGVAAILVPVLELGVAAALAPDATARVGAVAACALLVAFAAAIARAIRRGEQPDCHCFGQIHSAPAGPSTLLRNAALAAMALFVAVAGPSSGAAVTHRLSQLSPTQWTALIVAGVLSAAVAFLAWFCLQLLRQQGRLLKRLEAVERGGGGKAATASPSSPRLELGATAPELVLSTVDGTSVTLGSLRREGKPTALVFTAPSCAPCEALLPELGRWEREFGDRATLVAISQGSLQHNASLSAEHGISRTVVQTDREAMVAFGIQGTPSAVLISPDGRIASAVGRGSGEIRALLDRAAEPPRGSPAVTGEALVMPHASTPRPGDAAPDFALPSLDGDLIVRSELQGRATVLLFWDPRCGFCQGMLSDLHALEADPPPHSPRLVLVSGGGAEENGALKLRAPVVADLGRAVMRTYGARATPSAILVDETGRVASPLAVGASEVLAVARGDVRAAA